MIRLLVGLVLLVTTIATAETDCDIRQTMRCERCDPGNSKAAAQKILCTNCTTANFPECVPIVSCVHCEDDVLSSRCSGCTLTIGQK